MFYRQCNNCNERWELGTGSTCTCVTNASETIPVDSFSHLGKRTWVGLTDEEISAIDWKSDETLHDFAHAIEAKLKEKNT
jgi:hypothetical protein